MLDAGEELWLWQGWWPEIILDDTAEMTVTDAETTTTVDHRGSSSTRLQAERRAAMQTALDYWKRKYGENDDDDPKVYLVWAGLEPLRFTNCFPEWIDRDDIAEINMKVSLLTNIEYTSIFLTCYVIPTIMNFVDSKGVKLHTRIRRV